MDNLDIGVDSRSVVDRMEHVHVSARDVDKTAAFYKAAFGFEVRHDGTGPYGRTVHVGTDRFYIAISEGGDPERGSGNFSHVGFVTPDLGAFRANEAWDTSGGNEVHFVNLPSDARIRLSPLAG